jgi:hypothetical protein
MNTLIQKGAKYWPCCQLMSVIIDSRLKESFKWKLETFETYSIYVTPNGHGATN